LKSAENRKAVNFRNLNSNPEGLIFITPKAFGGKKVKSRASNPERVE